MRKIYLIIISLAMLGLTACATDEILPHLDTPENIVVYKNTITFDAVEHATSYIINAEGVNTEVFETTHTFIEPGTYNVKIRAIAEGYRDSLFSSNVQVMVAYLSYPTNIHIENNRLLFTPAANATAQTSYNVEINGEVFNTNQTLPPYLLPGTYQVRIQAIDPVYVNSEYSPLIELVLDENARLTTAHIFTYSIASKFDLPLYVYTNKTLLTTEVYQIEIDDHGTEDSTDDEEIETQIDSSRYIVSNNTVYLSAAYLNDLVAAYGEAPFKAEYQFKLVTNLGDHQFKVTINNEHKPYIYSDYNVVTNFYDDVVFRFEPFDATFVSVVGNGITSEDYIFENNVLTIKQTFITTTFGQNPTRKNMIMTYRLESGKTTYLGFITISK